MLLASFGAVPPSAPDDPAAVALGPCCSVPAPRVAYPGPQVKGGGFTAPALGILLQLVWVYSRQDSMAAAARYVTNAPRQLLQKLQRRLEPVASPQWRVLSYWGQRCA